MHQPEFLIFLENLQEYLNAELCFIETEFSHPVARIKCARGWVTIYFNHAKTEEEAKRDWERRKGRVNYQNLYIIMYYLDGITKEDMWRLEAISCKNKVVFSEKTYEDIPFVATLKRSPNTKSTNFLDKNFGGIRSFERQFDVIKFLNT